MNEHAIQNLDQAIRQLIVSVNNSTAAALAGLPQFYTLDDLAARWAMGRDAVRALLIEHRIIVPQGPGRHTIRVALEQVLQMDRVLKSRTTK